MTHTPEGGLQSCPHLHLRQGWGGEICLMGRSRPQWTTSVIPRLWIDPCIASRKQQTLSGEHAEELSRKKVLEVSRRTILECCRLRAEADYTQF